MISLEENRIKSQELIKQDSNDGIAYNTKVLEGNVGPNLNILGKAFDGKAAIFAANTLRINNNDCPDGNCEKLSHENQILQNAPQNAMQFITQLKTELSATEQPNYDTNNPYSYMVINNIINGRLGFGPKDGYNIDMNLVDDGSFDLKASGPGLDEPFKINSGVLNKLVMDNKSLISQTPNINEGAGAVLIESGLFNPAHVNKKDNTLTDDAKISLADFGVLNVEGEPVYDQVEIEIEGEKYMRNVYKYDEGKIIKRLKPFLDAEISGILSDEQSGVALWNMYLANDTSMVEDDERVEDKNAGDKSWAYQDLPLSDKQKQEFSLKYQSYFVKNQLLPFIQNQVPPGDDGKPIKAQVMTDEELYKQYLG